MKEGLKSGDTVQMREFRVLRFRARASRKAMFSRIGERVVVDSKRVRILSKAGF